NVSGAVAPLITGNYVHDQDNPVTVEVAADLHNVHDNTADPSAPISQRFWTYRGSTVATTWSPDVPSSGIVPVMQEDTVATGALLTIPSFVYMKGSLTVNPGATVLNTFTNDMTPTLVPVCANTDPVVISVFVCDPGFREQWNLSMAIGATVDLQSSVI